MRLTRHTRHTQALAVGIFPYVIKLLQSPDPSLRHILVFVWAKIMALDRTCQVRCPWLTPVVSNESALWCTWLACGLRALACAA